MKWLFWAQFSALQVWVWSVTSRQFASADLKWNIPLISNSLESGFRLFLLKVWLFKLASSLFNLIVQCDGSYLLCIVLMVPEMLLFEIWFIFSKIHSYVIGFSIAFQIFASIHKICWKIAIIWLGTRTQKKIIMLMINHSKKFKTFLI